MFSRPSLQKRKHAKTATSDGTHFREFNDDNPGVCLRSHGFAQLISERAPGKAPPLSYKY